jgi:Zn-dependent protease
MRDPLTWSFPIGRLFGITVRVHLLFLLFSAPMIARALPDYVAQACILQLLLFGSILLHEFGHCFAARQVDGDASEILMWPLGGLAFVEVPNTPRANFITAAGGPAVNVLLFLLAGGVLAAYDLLPPFSPFWDAYRPSLESWSTGAATTELEAMPVLMARLFWVNWLLFWFNILLVGFPLDGGRLVQCLLWPRFGYRNATLAVVYSGWIIALAIGVYVFITFKGVEDLLLLCLAYFVYVTCKQQFLILQAGALGDESVLGYDFSQGYTSLEQDQPAPRKPKQSFWQRWLQRRAAQKRRREEERRQAEEQRVDELLAKVQREGMQALSDEERRFLTRVSAKYRNRHQS